ncbi:hypothetical protein [Brasilonema sp. UFV-L1]|uniref:hypothetical protein n=1 Tax=Brasilonema sp. UFV-L1 TaxID=2234130 RepID=UPI00145E1A1A|nr:hypothetical protein [Brasilonema sp. UFV-L1]NMG09795.1 hypothetical protein [Brasilonema sp. UFV-L1]
MENQDESTCLLLQELRQILDGSQQEVQLYELISKFCQQTAGSFQRRKAFIPLLKQLQQLRGLAKPRCGFKHEKYPDVLHDTLIQVRDRLCTEFQPMLPTLRGSLTVWINEKLRLKYKVIELFSDQIRREISIDNLINTEQGGETFAEIVSDRTIDGTIRLSGIFRVIDEENRQQSQEFDRKLRDYFEQDPQGRLQNCHPKCRNNCNCQELIKRRFLKDPPDKWHEIAKDFNISHGTVTSHWQRKCEPLIREMTQNLGYARE